MNDVVRIMISIHAAFQQNFKEITLLGRKKLEELPKSFEIDLEKEESSGHLKQIIIGNTSMHSIMATI